MGWFGGSRCCPQSALTENLAVMSAKRFSREVNYCCLFPALTAQRQSVASTQREAIATAKVARFQRDLSPAFKAVLAARAPLDLPNEVGACPQDRRC
jgi:hypothetical protein